MGIVSQLGAGCKAVGDDILSGNRIYLTSAWHHKINNKVTLIKRSLVRGCGGYLSGAGFLFERSENRKVGAER